MAKLTAKGRNALPKGDFAGPDRSYPVNARATQAVESGRMSSSEKAKIDAKANRVLADKVTKRLDSRDKK